MMRRVVMSALVLAVAPWVRGQAPVIGAGDMFNEVGLYYRSYANAYNSLLGTGTYLVDNRMGAPGEDRFWDFSQGPTERVLRFDYLEPTGLAQAVDFPEATIVEKKTVEGVGDEEWLMFAQLPGIGRRVYGFYSEAYSPFEPSVAFSQPIVDFPDTIAYQGSWTASYIAWSVYPSLDPEVADNFRIRTTASSTFNVDAWGVVLLPNLGLVDALRINEEQVLDLAVDWGDGEIQQIETDYVRSYYWLSPGRGIVAQLTSTALGATPPANFSDATAFVRMFETNKEGTSGATDPQPVSNLRVTVSNGRVLVQWNKAANATRYRVEYSSSGWDAQNWQMLGEETTNDFLFDPDGIGEGRFYRVVSLR